MEVREARLLNCSNYLSLANLSHFKERADGICSGKSPEENLVCILSSSRIPPTLLLEIVAEKREGVKGGGVYKTNISSLSGISSKLLKPSSRIFSILSSATTTVGSIF